jgi:succinate dehydrogenase/fumarate reductase cytochrome b subunit
VSWQLVMAASLVAAGAYAAIAYLIVSGLVASGQLRSNRLGVATALIFVTAAVHHGLEGVQLLLPSLGTGKAHGLALRDAWDWHTVVWDIVTAAAGIYYLSLRGSDGSAPRGAQMFEDLKVRERQALEINDNIVQGLTVAKYAMTIGANDQSQQAIEDTLTRARAIITDLLGEPGTAIELGPGDLRRVEPAAVVAKKEPPAA